MLGVGRMSAGVDSGWSLHRIAVFAAVACVCAWPAFTCCGAEAQEPAHRLQFLVLHSGDSLRLAGEEIMRGFNGAIQGGISNRPTVFTEYLDADRFPGPENQGRMLTFLQGKYATTHIDLVLALGPSALKFLASNRPSLFPDAPIVFAGINEDRLRGLVMSANTSGVISRFDPAATVDLALALQPSATALVVISGAAAFDREWEQIARAKLKRFEGRLSVRYLSGLPMKELLLQVSQQPRNSVILFLTILEDGGGEKFVSRDAVDMVASAASAPLYGVYDTYIGRGIVGSYTPTFEDTGAEAGNMALRVLAREKSAGVEPNTATTNSFLVDWRQLQRWGLSESNLPQAAIVRFKEPSLWNLYRGQIIVLAVVLLVQFALIVGLLIQARRRRRAEESLRDTEERMSLAVESTDLGLWQLDVGACRIWATETCRAMLGLAPGETVTQQSFSNACHPDDRLETKRICDQAITRGQSYEHEYRLLGRDGRIRWVLDRTRTICDSAGRSLRMTGVMIDITDRKSAEESLRESEERYCNVVETQTEMICRFRPDTTLTFVNDAYCRYFERSRDQLVGTKFIELIPESARDAILRQIDSLLSRPRTQTYEHEVLRPDGTIGWHQWFDHVVVGSNGEVVELQGIGRDITNLRRAELDAQERRKEVTHLTRVAILGELSGALAHELNQPLTAILSNAQAAQRLLAKDPVDLGEVREILGDICDEDKRAGDVINRLRALLKRGEARLLPLNLNELANDVLELAHSELVERNVAVTARLAPGLPDIRGDHVQLQQVLLNLIMNACEAMTGNGNGARSLEVSTGRDGSGRLRLTVADHGPGIPSELIDHVFEPFVTTKTHGLGLGLSICHSIVAAHDGRLWVANNPDHGASFFISLPIHARGHA